MTNTRLIEKRKREDEAIMERAWTQHELIFNKVDESMVRVAKRMKNMKIN
jgi:hypothetical protein